MGARRCCLGPTRGIRRDRTPGTFFAGHSLSGREIHDGKTIEGRDVTILSEQNSVGAAAFILRRALQADRFYRAIMVDSNDREEVRNEALQSYVEFAIEEAVRCGDRL